LKAFDFEFALDANLDTALNFLNKAHAKVQPKTKTKVQMKAKAITPVKTLPHP